MSRNNDKTMMQLFWPVFFELLLQTLVGIIDVVMVAMVGDVAVAAVGTANTYLTMVGTLLTIVSYGALTVMTQNIGAGRTEVAYKAKNVGLIFNLLIGGLFSALFIFLSGPLLRMLSTADALYADTVTYISTVGASCAVLAVTNIYSAFLRSYGQAKPTLFSAMTGNILNLILNYAFIKSGMGVFGIALATFITRCVNMTLCIAFSVRIRDGRGVPCSRAAGAIFKDMIRIGLPSACESTLFYLCTSAVIVCINRMDEGGIAAGVYSYCNQLSNLIYCIPLAISQANAIIVGWRIGEGRFDECYKQTKVSFITGTAASTVISIICFAAGRPLIGLLTENADILSMVAPVMAVNIVRDFGRTGNNVYGMGLKVAGDAVSTLIIGLPVMPLCAFIGGWLLGLKLGYGIIGAWIGIALDEFIRFFMMLLRWKSGAWEKKSLVKM